MKALEISRSGMDVEWRRLEVIAENIANANTAATANGQPYTPMSLLSGPKIGFARHLDEQATGLAPTGVMAYGVEPQNLPPRKVYDPSHPQADADGYVSYPGIDQAKEMTTMIKTARAYEANIVAMNMARQMYAKALEIGKR